MHVPSLPVVSSPSIWVQPDEVLSIELDIVRNCIWVKDRQWQFSRRWEVALLAKLLSANDHGHKYTLSALQQDLQQRGQSSLLNRAQISRLLSSIHEFLALLPGLQLQHLPRQASTGPWSLQVARPVRWSVMPAAHAASLSMQRSELAWVHPSLLCRDSPPCANRLHQLLRQIVTAEAFAKYGEHASALDVLSAWGEHQLSSEAKTLLRLRQIDWLRRTGQFERARQGAHALCEAPAVERDPSLTVQARHLLRRIDYDENPTHAWRQLLDDPQTPTIHAAVCWQTQSDWHNLQALALRRAAQETQDSSTCALHHANAMLHLEAALYGAIRQQNWDRLHAFIDNLAFHLQKMQPTGNATLQQVHDWYGLSLACADKLDSGADDMWDMVYFGEFWLDHAHELAAQTKELTGALGPLPNHPKTQDYWSHLCQMAADHGTPRLRAIALVLYARWAQLQKHEMLAQQQHAKLAQLLANHAGLAECLASDGYAQWLPA